MELESKDSSKRKPVEKFRTIFENAGDAIFIHDLEGHFIEVNQAACESLGYRREELLQMTQADIGTPKYADLKNKRIKEVPNQRNILVETFQVRRDGKAIPTELSNRIIEYAGKAVVLSIARDITRRRQSEEKLKTANDELGKLVKERTTDLESVIELLREEITDRREVEKALKESENKFRTIYNNAIDGMLLAEPESKKFYTGNKKICRMLGYSLEEIESLGVVDIHPEKELPGIIKKFEGQAKGEIEMATDIPVKRKDGTVFYADINSSFIILEGKAYLLGIFRDITDRKKAEEQIKASLEEKEILLKEIHHRVKNNLQIVCSLINLQKETIKDKETYEMVSECQNRIKAIALVHEKLYNSESLANINFKEYIIDLINSLFNFYEVNSNKITSKMDIDNILLGINSAIPCGLIVNELLGNSLQYAFPKGREGEIKVAAHLINADEINIIVSDNGVGLPAETDIINPESLGLQIVDILVKQLRGKIEIDRSNGTAFRVTLRLRK